MPGGKRRVHPLDHRDPRSASSSHAASDAIKPSPELVGQPLGSVRHAGSSPHFLDGIQYVLERMGVEREHVGVTAQVVQGVCNLARRQRADPAQILGEDQLWVQGRERAGVQGVEIVASGRLRADIGVDLARGHTAGIPAAHDDCLVLPSLRRLVAFESNPDQLVAEA